MNSKPTLPVELERQIFELAAFIHPQCMPNLLLVAHRAKIWIEPIMYEVISIHMPGRRGFFRLPLRNIAKLITVNPKCVRDYTRHVCVVGTGQMDVMIDFLSRCGSVVNVFFVTSAIRWHPNLLPMLDTQPLQRLSANLRQLFSWDHPIDFSHRVFSRITHLDLMDRRCDDWDTCSGLAQLPCLTHLSSPAMSDSTIHGALRHCPLLEVLVIVHSQQLELQQAELNFGTVSDDPRFVRLVVTDRLSDWEMGARGGEDYWIKAKALVDRRRYGKPSNTKSLAENPDRNGSGPQL
ncbi:hypothetical protein DFH06DRAFT_363198 [Mycena polygramma]|nr:hypothetical protein DFH06DRAFT_363198 [Mycena polygramma]